jgi:carbonyl reductase 1
MASSTEDSNAYGLSKAFLNAYTVLHAKQDPDLIINSCTPGYIATDITKGMGATNPPSKGAVPPVTLLMSDDFSKLPTGRYYGSDCVRSPIDRYRDPGAPPYEGP